MVQRPRSNTPLQALVLLNDPTYVEAARGFAARMIREGGADPRLGSNAASAWRFRARRGPQEVAVLLDLLHQHLRSISARARRGPRLARRRVIAPIPPDIDPAELAAWTSVARVLLNLHETITRS